MFWNENRLKKINFLKELDTAHSGKKKKPTQSKSTMFEIKINYQRHKKKKLIVL